LKSLDLITQISTNLHQMTQNQIKNTANISSSKKTDGDYYTKETAINYHLPVWRMRKTSTGCHYHRAGSAFVSPSWEPADVVVPLVDITQQTGTTALWEGSHRIKSRAEETHRSTAQLERLEGAVLPWPKMGDSFFMDFRLRHTGTPNLGDSPRPILYLVYSRRWFQDRKNFDMQSPLLISREEFENIPDEFKHLFGNARPE
jgi:ectoine hydroxylase-related dioxygenase (phytanoyl-CoA dioxygenase family)